MAKIDRDNFTLAEVNSAAGAVAMELEDFDEEMVKKGKPDADWPAMELALAILEALHEGKLTIT